MQSTPQFRGFKQAGRAARMGRLPALLLEQLSPAQTALYRAVAEGPRGQGIALQGPFKVWMHSPEFGLQAQQFGAHVRYDGSLPSRVFELAVLVCARHWRAEFESLVHAPLAVAAGIPEDIVNALISGEQPPFTEVTDSIVFKFSQTLLEKGRVPDDLYHLIIGFLSIQQMIELTGVIGYYTLVALTLNAFEVEA